MSSSLKLLDSNVGNGSSSRMRFFLLREFFFNVDLARVAFVVIMFESQKYLGQPWGSRSQSRSEIEEVFRNRPLHELFEWSETRRRPVLTQCVLDLEQEITQHLAFNEPDGFARMSYNPSSMWTADSELDVEEPSAESRDSMPLEIDFNDVHNQVRLGQGSFGILYRCRWHGQVAAMKIIQLAPEDPMVQRAFEMEVKILASLQHPNAVPVFRFGYIEKTAEGFFVMEHMQTDLANLIRERQRDAESRVFPIDVALDIMVQIAEGMCALRRQRVIHRDLKPANILVNQPDVSMGLPKGFYDVKLADFGCSNVRDNSDSVFSTLRMGTPAYMAPEVMSPTSLPERNDEHGYSWKADVYSFSMVCAEILSGERPFQNLGRMDKIFAAVSSGERPKLCLGGGDPLRRLIEDCWKFNAEERPDFVEVRRRLWECREFHLFKPDELSASWETFRARLDARSDSAAMEINDSQRSWLIPRLAYKGMNAVSRWMARK